jgi:hypothetical protein
MLYVLNIFFNGFNPDTQFTITIDTIDEHHFFKKIMGLYVGFQCYEFLAFLTIHI